MAHVLPQEYIYILPFHDWVRSTLVGNSVSKMGARKEVPFASKSLRRPVAPGHCGLEMVVVGVTKRYSRFKQTML